MFGNLASGDTKLRSTIEEVQDWIVFFVLFSQTIWWQPLFYGRKQFHK